MFDNLSTFDYTSVTKYVLFLFFFGSCLAFFFLFSPLQWKIPSNDTKKFLVSLVYAQEDLPQFNFFVFVNHTSRERESLSVDCFVDY